MAFLDPRETLDRMVRGNALALTKQEISQTISFARIVLIVGLVFLHYDQYPDIKTSPFSGMNVSDHPLATFVNSFMLFFFFSVVPLLSMVSGWLFFSFDENTASRSLRQRMGRRFTSVYLPMVCWDIVYLGILALLFLWNPGYPLLHEMNFHFDHATAMDYINAIFAITKHPVGFQFWFVRDLFVTALVSPLLWLSLKHTPYLGMVILGGAWITGNDLLIFFRPDVVFFFYLGGFLQIRQIPLHLSARTSRWLLVTYIAVVTLRTMAPLVFDLSGHRPELLTAATRSMRLLGVLACWGSFQQWAQTRAGLVIARFGGLAFFLHSAHYPLIAEVKILLWPLLPSHSDVWFMMHYVASVAITVVLGVGTGVLLTRKAPGLFALMNGGRPGIGVPKSVGAAFHEQPASITSSS